MNEATSMFVVGGFKKIRLSSPRLRSLVAAQNDARLWWSMAHKSVAPTYKASFENCSETVRA